MIGSPGKWPWKNHSLIVTAFDPDGAHEGAHLAPPGRPAGTGSGAGSCRITALMSASGNSDPGAQPCSLMTFDPLVMARRESGLA